MAKKTLTQRLEALEIEVGRLRTLLAALDVKKAERNAPDAQMEELGNQAVLIKDLRIAVCRLNGGHNWVLSKVKLGQHGYPVGVEMKCSSCPLWTYTGPPNKLSRRQKRVVRKALRL